MPGTAWPTSTACTIRGCTPWIAALVLNPNSVPALCSSGWVRIYVDDARVAIDHFRRAIRLNPMAPQHSYPLTGLGWDLLMCDRLDEALATLQEAFLESMGLVDHAARHHRLPSATGTLGEARAAAAQLLRRVPHLCISNYRAMTPDVRSAFLEKHMTLIAAAGIPP